MKVRNLKSHNIHHQILQTKAYGRRKKVGSRNQVLKKIHAHNGKLSKVSPGSHMSLKKIFSSSGTINCQYYCILHKKKMTRHINSQSKVWMHKNKSSEPMLPCQLVTAFGEVHQSTWVSWKELSHVQMNPEHGVRNGENHMTEFHRVLPI